MRMTKTLWPLCVAAVALGLNGCGGGSTTQPEPTPTMPPAKETPMVEAPAAPETPAPTVTSLRLDEKALLAGIAAATDADNPTNYMGYATVAHGGKVSEGGMMDVADNVLVGTDYAESPVLAPEVEGWMSSVYMREKQTAGVGTPGAVDDVTTSDMVTSYTNMKAPTIEERFYATYFDDTAGEHPTHVADVMPGGVLYMVDGSQDDAVAVHSFVSADGLPSAKNQEYSWGADGNQGTDLPTEAKGLSGMFNGIAGTYWCARDCSASTDNEGNVSFDSADWRFTPDATATQQATLVVEESVPASKFLTFGYWLRTTTDKDGPTYMVDTFAMGKSPAMLPTASELSDVQGSADYVGPAVGLFVKRETTSVGDGDPVLAGRFTAQSALTAHFSGNVPADKTNMISGTISNFMHLGEMIDEEWMVKLMDAPIAVVGQAFQALSGTAMPEGNWTGAFHGGELTNTAEADDEDFVDPPGSVAGTFDAMFNNGEVIGAFGATR